MAGNNEDPSLLKSLNERIRSAYATKELSDCEFSVGEVRVQAHKFVMSLSSPVFKAMFHGDLAETGAAPIRVTDIEADAFNAMLCFMYTDAVEFTSPKCAAQVLQAARKYIMPHLVTMCTDHITAALDSTTFYELLEFTGSHSMEDVSEACVQHIKTNTTVLLNDEKFKEADLSVVKLIVQQNELNIKSELELFKAVEQWAVSEAEKRAVALDDVLPELEDVIGSIRFKVMSLDELKSGIENSPLLSKEEKLALITNKINSSMLPYPQRFSSCNDIRLSCASTKVWKLVRTTKDDMIYYVGDGCPTHKSFTVSRPIKLKGLQISGFDAVVKIKKDDWHVQVEGSYLFNFSQPVHLVAGEVYWIEITTKKSYVQWIFGTDFNTTYKLNNMTITMSDHYSTITKLIFEEL